MIVVTKDNFQEEVIDYKGYVFVDFYAPWCGPCKMTAPIIEEIAKEKTDMKFVKVNVDENPELSTQYSIFSIPTFVIFKNGQVSHQFVGAHGKDGFLEEIKRATTS